MDAKLNITIEWVYINDGTQTVPIQKSPIPCTLETIEALSTENNDILCPYMKIYIERFQRIYWKYQHRFTISVTNNTSQS